MNELLHLATTDPWFGWLLIGLVFAACAFFGLLAADILDNLKCRLFTDGHVSHSGNVVDIAKRRREAADRARLEIAARVGGRS